MITRVVNSIAVCLLLMLAASSPASTWALQTEASEQTLAHEAKDADASPVSVQLIRHEGKVDVMVGDDLFTAYDFKTHRKPILYPVHAPGQISMTRDWPIKSDTPGESHDHPHHKSLWFSGEINGINFWAERASRVEVKTVETDFADNPGNVIRATSDWIRKKGSKAVLADQTTYWFGGDSKSRWIDCLVEVRASYGDIEFKDTKEGVFAIRTHPDLRLEANPAKGVDKVFGQARNSEGVTGKKVWGKKAKWMLYFGQIDGRPTSLLMCDHPTNLRHPTTWHARHYGLVAANPFGLHHFQGKEKGEGAFKVAAGEVLQLRYRVEFFAGIIDAKTAEEKFLEFAKQPLDALEAK